MYRDNSLIPTEALRLAMLGFLAEGPRRYADLAATVRRFASRMAGPSLDLLAPSLELLRFEGLVVPLDGESMEDNPSLRLTPDGEKALNDLLTANMRPTVNDLNKLVVALKLRFLHLLDREDRLTQIEMLEDLYRTERARLVDLRTNDEEATADGFLAAWLDQEIAQVDSRLAWCQGILARA
ncbi:MAG: hypothetical protein KJ904_01920 [Alphaproteobacteria bacterium]|nr:hypothetical protein [Alphaproteobacteria bacterium]MBU0797562.1 hypothetical protein [Alphaproteobacteria bacterium]MBU0885893.1 hypothetical protein [Alphaproteobacteria bacterium]MBU1814607.1 hypothetical protein [Alphaproteobacteria bacterium]MBU2091982.1 hypothetical protein [Alphaproteobacteria bacterium]